MPEDQIDRPERPEGTTEPEGRLLAVEHQFSGPLPPPQILQRYDEILPGAAERILAMAERQGRHRQDLESRSLESQARDLQAARREARLGQIFALLIALAGIAAGTFIIWSVPGVGGVISGSVLGGAPVAAIVIAFIHGRHIGANGDGD